MTDVAILLNAISLTAWWKGVKENATLVFDSKTVDNIMMLILLMVGVAHFILHFFISST